MSHHPTTHISTVSLILLLASNITSCSPLTFHSSPPLTAQAPSPQTHHRNRTPSWSSTGKTSPCRTAFSPPSSPQSTTRSARNPPSHPSQPLLTQLPQISPAEIARLYGPDMTYYAVENYLRKFRRDAKEMKKEAGDRDVPASSPARKKASPVKGGELPRGVEFGDDADFFGVQVSRAVALRRTRRLDGRRLSLRLWRARCMARTRMMVLLSWRRIWMRLSRRSDGFRHDEH
jgi:hypothetical protein